MIAKLPNAETALHRMEASGQPAVNALAAAIGRSGAGAYDPGELEQLAAIETLRDELSRSSRVLSVMDYGAGEPDSPRLMSEASLGVEKTITLAKAATWTSTPSPWGRVLFNLVREFRPVNVLELGTCIGLSASYLCAALSLNGGGRLATLEGAPAYAAMARTNLERLGFSNFDVVVGRFEDTLPEVLLRQGTVDFLFNDGHHDGEAMVRYFEQALPRLSQRAILCFDDLSSYESMMSGWGHIKAHPRVRTVVDFGQRGLCRLGPPSQRKERFDFGRR